MEYGPIKPFNHPIPRPSSNIASMHMFFFSSHLFTPTGTCTSRKHLSSFFETLSDWSALILSLLQLRCFPSCQNASLQVNSDLKTSSPWECLQQSLLSSFKHNLSGSFLSAPPTPCPTPFSVWFCSLSASSCICLSATVVHGPPHHSSAPSFNEMIVCLSWYLCIYSTAHHSANGPYTSLFHF